MYGHVWTQMKGPDELITIFHTRTYWHAPIPRDIHFNVLWSRSNINENYLLHLHFISHVRCYMWGLISRFTSLFSMAQQWSSDILTQRGEIYFWKTISLAHLFLCSVAPIQNYFSQFTINTSVTSLDTIGTWELISQRTCSLRITSALPHPGSDRTHVILFIPLDIFFTPIFRAHTPTCMPI